MKKTKQKKEKIKLLPYEVIQRATQGDSEAMQAILIHYEGYIRSLSTRIMVDDYGTKYSFIDTELQERLKTKLITKTLEFNPLPYEKK